MSIEKYKLRYDKSTGKILELSASVSEAGQGEGIADYIGEHPGNLSYFKRLANGDIVEKSRPEKDEVDKKVEPIKKDRFKKRFNALNDQKKEKVRDELFAKIAEKVLTEDELEEVIK